MAVVICRKLRTFFVLTHHMQSCMHKAFRTSLACNDSKSQSATKRVEIELLGHWVSFKDFYTVAWTSLDGKMGRGRTGSQRKAAKASWQKETLPRTTGLWYWWKNQVFVTGYPPKKALPYELANTKKNARVPRQCQRLGSSSEFVTRFLRAPRNLLW